jgi:hypothetical protein
MSESSRFAKEPQRWVDELWNVSLFPVTTTAREQQLTLSGLENIGERRRTAAIHRPLRVSLESSGGNLG